MKRGQVQGTRAVSTGLAKRVLGFAQDRNQMRAEEKWEQFTEALERTNKDRASGSLKKEKEHMPHVYLGSGIFTEDGGLRHVSSQASSNWSNREVWSGDLHKSLTPWSQGSWHQGVSSQWSWTMTISPTHSLDVLYWAGRLQRPLQVDIHEGMCKGDGGAGPSKKRSRKSSKGKTNNSFFFPGVPSVSLSYRDF